MVGIFLLSSLITGDLIGDLPNFLLGKLGTDPNKE